MGLVNTVTKSELKAIIAHEFGHFSQRTMKVGSYVYNVNQVIFNMLYDNESYENLVQQWANVSGYFSIFVVIAVKINMGIQWILQKLYDVVNRSYLALSREMEFHADEIAAHVTGYEPLKTSLLRLPLADQSFNAVLEFYGERIEKNEKSRNIYLEHQFVIGVQAQNARVALINNLPAVTLDDYKKFNKSKLVVKDQWASHPSTAERIDRLEQTNIRKGIPDHSPATSIFKNAEKLQEELTEILFGAAKYAQVPNAITLQTFKDDYNNQVEANSFSKIYNGYYADKNPSQFDLTTEKHGTAVSVNELFSDQMVAQIYTAIGLQQDIETLTHVSNGNIAIKSFDYEGTKYKRKHVNELLHRLNAELEQLNEKIKTHDYAIYHHFLCLEQDAQKSPQLVNWYKRVFEFDQEFKAKSQIYVTISKELQFLERVTPYEQISTSFSYIARLEEELKTAIRAILDDEIFQAALTPQTRETLTRYISQSWKYFEHERYIDENLELLLGALGNYSYVLLRGGFMLKKNLLDYQASLLEGSSTDESLHLQTTQKSLN